MRGALALLGFALLGACAQRQTAAPVPAAAGDGVRLGSDGRPAPVYDGTPIDKVGFRPGVSSATVEKLAMAAGCTGGVGAGLVTEPGPIEVYRMSCDNGKVFLARCELRQCKPMQK